MFVTIVSDVSYYSDVYYYCIHHLQELKTSITIVGNVTYNSKKHHLQ